MADLTTAQALDDVRSFTFACLVTHLIALKAELRFAIEAIVIVVSAEYACHSLLLVWTLPRHVAKLLAPEAFDRRVSIHVVPRTLLLKLLELGNPLIVFVYLFLLRFDFFNDRLLTLLLRLILGCHQVAYI